MRQHLWDKASTSTPDERVQRFLAGDDVRLDRELFLHDVRASRAHVAGLLRIGVLSPSETASLEAALLDLAAEFSSGSFVLDDRFEDGHSAIELYLTDRLGDTGRKVHTGRSRNDQVLVALRLHARESIFLLRDRCLDAASALLERAEAQPMTPMPGYTHLQRAVPSSVGLWLAAFVEAFLDDAEHAIATHELLDCCPLGTAAGYGVNLPLDREGVARDLGFRRVQQNPMYAQNSRGKFDLALLSSFAQATLDLRRFAWDLSLYSTAEFGFIRLPDRFTTGSSIMPNKRNPDVVELLRTVHGVVAGAETEIASDLSLPSGYHRDLQATKAPTLRAVRAALDGLSLLPDLVTHFVLCEPAMRAAISADLYATDRAVDLARQGVPFREAYQRVATDLEGSPSTPEQSLEARVSPGATGALGLPALRERLVRLR